METRTSDSPDIGTIRGALLAESLRPGSRFSGHGMRVLNCSRYVVSDHTEAQPEVWTAIEFEAPESESGQLAQELSEALAEPGWYVNWSSAEDVTVVFSGKVFRYRRGDQAGRAVAAEHGRQHGVPEPQLDWSE